MKIKGAIFDLDGTILDSMFIWDTIGEDYLIKRGIVPEEGLNEKFKTMSILQAAEYYQVQYGLKDTIQEIVNGVNEMIDHLYSDVVMLKPGIKKVLNNFKNDGVKMCVATATDRYMVEAALKLNNISDYFSDILTCSEVGFGKDSPVIFEEALKKIGTKKSETLLFEDALHAIETAKKSDFKVVGVYDKSSEKEKQEIMRISDYYIDSFDDWSKAELTLLGL